jgi:hypothetical protein
VRSCRSHRRDVDQANHESPLEVAYGGRPLKNRPPRGRDVVRSERGKKLLSIAADVRASTPETSPAGCRSFA